MKPKEEISKEEQARNAAYNEYVKQITPKSNLFKNCTLAFLLGGTICLIGQGILWILTNCCKLPMDDAKLWCSITLILLSVILTATNLYPSLANWGGAGALVPITGFANGICSSAIEFQKEGQVFGIGCQIFRIAGPVILYGIFSSWIAGFLYWILSCFMVQ